MLIKMVWSVLTAILSLSAFAQDNNRCEELLSCLPDGKYTRISFENVEVLLKSPIYKKLKEEKPPFELRRVVPEIIDSDSVLVKLKAEALKLDDSELHKDPGARRDSKSSKYSARGYGISYNGERRVIYNVGETFEVFICDDAKLAVQNAVQKSRLVPTGDYVGGIQIFSCNDRDYYRERRFVLPLEANLVLVADSVYGLQAMFEAYYGYSLSFIDSKQYELIFKVISRTEFLWSYENLKIGFDEIVEMGYLQGLEKDEESLDPVFILSTRNYDKQHVSTKYKVFAGEEAAVEGYLREKSRMDNVGFHSDTPKSAKELTRAMEGKITIERDENVVITTTVYDEKIDEAARKYIEDMREKRSKII